MVAEDEKDWVALACVCFVAEVRCQDYGACDPCEPGDVSARWNRV